MPAAVYPPGPRNPLPIGTFIDFIRRPTELLTRIAQQYGDIAHLRFGTQHVYVINHPDYIKEMLVTKAATFAKGKLMEGARHVLGEGLLTSGGSRHVRQRRASAPAFHRQNIESYGQRMVQCAAQMANEWREGEERDIHADMMRLTLAIVGRTLFSAELEQDGELPEALNTFVRLSPLALLPFFEHLQKIPLPSTRRIQTALRQLDRSVARLVAAHRAPGRRECDDMLSMLLESYGSQVSEQELRDECVAMIFAGYETTSNALTWTWYLLSQNPDAEAKLHAEIEAVLAGRLPSSGDLKRLPYTEMVVSESMRMYPPAWAIGRRAIAPASLGGYPIGKNSLVICSQWVMHHDTRYFPNPYRFDPERWTPEARESRPHFSYFPFGAGPRQCIGEGFAWTETGLLIATLTQKWRLRLVPSHRVEPQALVTLRPKYGMKIRLERRT